MPRTIESIVDSHRRASALRAAGKPIWSQRIDIRTIIQESDERTLERIADIGVRIAALIRSAVPAAMFDITDVAYEQDLDETIEDLESYTTTGLGELEADGIDIVEMFDNRLDELYDWADRTRVWLG